MNRLKYLLKITLLLTLTSSFLLASQARPGTRVFTQPDGTKFEGILRGDSSFHWIESRGEVVLYNPNDKFYYKAKVDAQNNLVRSSQKPSVREGSLSSVVSTQKVEHKVSPATKEALQKLHKKSKTGNYPR